MNDPKIIKLTCNTTGYSQLIHSHLFLGAHSHIRSER
jgi:hypothetical protein